jgi:hypothetical protein
MMSEETSLMPSAVVESNLTPLCQYSKAMLMLNIEILERGVDFYCEAAFFDAIGENPSSEA